VRLPAGGRRLPDECAHNARIDNHRKILLLNIKQAGLCLGKRRLDARQERQDCAKSAKRYFKKGNLA
jgi:hypothetical protein